MRSRDGYCSHSFTNISITFLLFWCLPVLQADEYLISYRYTVKNALLYNETLDVSKAMTKCSGTLLPEYLLLPRENSKKLKKILLKNSDTFFQYISKIGLNVSNQDYTYNGKNNSFIIITLKTTCFKVDFNENFVKIAALK